MTMPAWKKKMQDGSRDRNECVVKPETFHPADKIVYQRPPSMRQVEIQQNPWYPTPPGSQPYSPAPLAPPPFRGHPRSYIGFSPNNSFVGFAPILKPWNSDPRVFLREDEVDKSYVRYQHLPQRAHQPQYIAHRCSERIVPPDFACGVTHSGVVRHPPPPTQPTHMINHSLCSTHYAASSVKSPHKIEPEWNVVSSLSVPAKLRTSAVLTSLMADYDDSGDKGPTKFDIVKPPLKDVCETISENKKSPLNTSLKADSMPLQTPTLKQQIEAAFGPPIGGKLF
eukprot:GHVL01003654.1.p1 GENE.GHVL01003654.1~~GHVL01003654.1.p1  ORF type:complete len:282 (+),score=46.06 GHVL01003654.1:321-1166(+)